jgi:lysozyme family protein
MTFEKYIERVLTHEGGYVNDPKDPGGETKFGISKRSYPNLNIAALTRDEAKAIYKRDFWLRVHADELPGPVAYQALDFAVNSGIETAIRKLQAALGVADDGLWGPVTRAAVHKANAPALIMAYAAERLDFLRKLRGWVNYGSGWAGRVAENLRYGAVDTA